MTFLLTNKCIKFQISEKKRNVNGHTIIDVSKRKVSTNENKKRKIFSEKADGAHTQGFVELVEMSSRTKNSLY